MRRSEAACRPPGAWGLVLRRRTARCHARAAGHEREGVFQPVDVRLAELAGIGMFNWVWRWYRPGRDDPEAIAELFTRIFIEGIRVRTNNGSSTDMPGSKTLPALAAEYHASEIRYHTEMLQRLIDATQTEPAQEEV
jgi:hypothetical protein